MCYDKVYIPDSRDSIADGISWVLQKICETFKTIFLKFWVAKGSSFYAINLSPQLLVQTKVFFTLPQSTANQDKALAAFVQKDFCYLLIILCK